MKKYFKMNLIKFKKGLKNIKLIRKLNKRDKLFNVIGEDRKIHKSDLISDKCYCGVKITKKFVTQKDFNNHFSCYECTF